MLKAIDLFCGAGGASVGMHRAGYFVFGIDIEPQPNYPFPFQQADALMADLTGYDLVWASPPCQAYSRMAGCRNGTQYQDLIGMVRAKLKAWSGHWIIENVAGAPLRDAVMLCGAMFGLPLYRHRYFESSFRISVPIHPHHDQRASKAGHWKTGTIISVAGHCAPIAVARTAMGIDWMTRDELTQSIPPVFSEYLTRQLPPGYPRTASPVVPTDRDRAVRD